MFRILKYLSKDFLFVILFSTVYALIEIEIEGKNGWMKGLPTPKVLKLGTKNMTLYHIYMLILIIGTIIFQNNMVFTLNSFLYSLTNILLILFLEDILWFIFNPHFTIKKYLKKDIWWHSKQPWYFGMPLHNYIISLIVLIISYYFYITNNPLHSTVFYNLIYSYIFVVFSIILSPIYHKFYNKIH